MDILKQLTRDISHEKTWTRLIKRNLLRETESLLITALNNTISSNHIKASVDKTQQNSRYGYRDEIINHILSECSKLAQKEYKTRHKWVGKVIHWELCRKFEFDHSNKWHMHNLASVLEKETRKFLWDFEIQTDHLMSARRPDLI